MRRNTENDTSIVTDAAASAALALTSIVGLVGCITMLITLGASS
jgi:hypothetical protein